ncbi:hypothetical protein EDB19DRAFT_1983262 [Suillus lakei]|nr:hypothetical protein EDB19DRAFT_1983262 [Suillus lakei]
MDLQSLASLFATTYNPDPNVQKTGGLRIGAQEGTLTALLQIITSDGAELATRQACSIYLKNCVHTSYILPPNPRPDHVPIAQSDRTALKANILPLLAASPSRSITVQLAAALKDLVAHDFPHRWSSLLDIGDVREVGTGVIAVLECVRAFRFRQKTDVLPGIIASLFPTLVTITDGMRNTSPCQPASKEIPAMLHLVFKTYKSAIIVSTFPHTSRAQSHSFTGENSCSASWGYLSPWKAFQLTRKAGRDANGGRSRSRRMESSVDCSIEHRSFGNPSQMPSPMQNEYGVFAEHFVTTFAPEIFKMDLNQVELYVSG